MNKPGPQGLIIAPTREIAVQIQEVLRSIGQFLEGKLLQGILMNLLNLQVLLGLTVECFIGGLPLDVDRTKCKSCHIAVGTPGRVKQLIQDGNLNTGSVKVFILDEADKLTEDSFQDDINEIYNSLPSRKQIIMCSATYSDKVKETLEHYLHSPVLVSVELETPLLLGLKQFVRVLPTPSNVALQIKLKNEELLKVVSSVSFVQCLVFSNYQSRAESVCNFLNRNGWNSVLMSAAQNQTQRLNSLSELKDFKCRILVTTDLVARGIDIANVDLVVNYDIPSKASTYLHRMGRAGRFGSSGLCLNLAFAGQETAQLQTILGCIGGVSMTIPVVGDQYQFNSSSDYLSGQLDDTYREEVKQVRTELAEHIEKNQPKKLNKKKQAKKVVETDSLLSQLASGEFELSNETNDSTELLRKLAEEGVETAPEPQSKEQIFCKNKALFSVAKIFSEVDGANENLNDISQYLSTLKSQEVDSPSTLENIFVLAYRSQVQPQAARWQVLIPVDEKSKLSDDYLQEEEEFYDEDYDFELEKDVQVNYEPVKVMEWMPVEPGKEVLKPRKNSQSALNQVSTAQPTSSSNVQVDYEHLRDYRQRYGKYYQHCSDNLWQNGLSFNSVQSFDEWFYYDWERQLNAVGNFVQNKIYLEEMSRMDHT